MPKFTVIRPEVHHSYVVIEAATADDALKAVKDGEGEEVSCEYSSTLDDDEYDWDVLLNDEEK
jgi:hypothetical protein